jgi:hypothetical protein
MDQELARSSLEVKSYRASNCGTGSSCCRSGGRAGGIRCTASRDYTKAADLDEE